MDLVSTFLYFLPLLTVVLLGVFLIGLAYNVYLDRKSPLPADPAVASTAPDTQVT